MRGQNHADLKLCRFKTMRIFLHVDLKPYFAIDLYGVCGRVSSESFCWQAVIVHFYVCSRHYRRIDVTL